MSKEVVIDPEWEERAREREDLSPPAWHRDDGAGGPMVVELGADDEDTAEEEFDEPPFDTDDHGAGFGNGGPDPARYADVPPPAQEDPFTRRDEDVPASKAKEYIGMLLSGSILTRTEVRRVYPYLLMIAFLMLLYISSLFRMQQLHRREIELTRRVKELRAVSLELSARRMNATRRSVIMDEVARRGIPLEESLTAPKIIER